MTSASISTIGKVIRGVSWDKDDASDSPRANYLPILRAGNIGNDLNIASDLVWVPASNIGPEQKIRAGDIAICMSSGSPAVVGKTASARQDWPGSVGAFCALIRANPEKCLPEYLAFFLKSARFRKWTSEAQGANIKNIKKSALEDFQISLPPLPEQRRIVDLLSRAEGIVRLRREAEKKAAELIPALFLDMFGDPAANPKGWPQIKIGESDSHVQIGPFGSLLHKEDYVSGGIPLINPMHIVKGRIEVGMEQTVRAEKAAELTSYRLAVGDVVMGRRGEMGRCAVVSPNEAGMLCGTGSLYIRPAPAEFLPIFLSAVLSCAQMKRHLERIAQGVTLANLNRTMIEGLQLPLPPISLQGLFVQRAQEAESIQFQQAAATAKAEATFGALLAQAFT